MAMLADICKRMSGSSKPAEVAWSSRSWMVLRMSSKISFDATSINSSFERTIFMVIAEPSFLMPQCWRRRIASGLL